MKKFVAILILVALIPSLNTFAISKNEPLKNLSKGMTNVLCGTIEIPDNVDETSSKGKKAFPDCTDTTKDDVGRGIAKVVGGLWQIVTFWYPTD